MNLATIAKLLEQFVTGIVILNNAGEIVLADSVAKSFSQAEGIVGKSFKEAFDLYLDSIINQKSVIKTQSGEKYTVEAREINAEQENYVLVLFTSMVDFDDSAVKLHCLEQVIDTINDGVIISDYKGRLVLYNRSQEDLEGLKSKEVVGKYLWQAYNYNPEMSEHRKIYNSGQPIINAYRAHAFKNGVPRYLSYSTYPIEKDGEIIAVYSISRNETTLKNLLHETIELKRRLFSRENGVKEIQASNGTKYSFADIKSRDSAVEKLIRESQRLSLSKTNLLIAGETGTGKELFAQSIHNFGNNQKEPFIAINCAAIPETLLESTLFGTVKGSYTGSVDQMGFFEAAGEGTLFLDEVNSLPVTLQAKLLRVIEEKSVRRVGGLKAIPVKCRLICAANQDPVSLVEQNKLREDFFFRIAGAIIQIPPLRERTADIIYLTEYFMEKYNKPLDKQVKRISPPLKKTLLTHQWPGNVRELEHIIESMITAADEKQAELDTDDLPAYFLRNVRRDNMLQGVKKEHKDSLPAALRELEEQIIRESLDRNGWNLSKTAKELGIIRQSLMYRMKKLNLEK